jgi:hypothetical protein
MESVGAASSLRMVPVPWATEIVALTAPDRSTLKVSSVSYVVSPFTATVTVFETWPGEKASEPDVAV